MARVVGSGHQDFETVRRKNNFYIDKTEFIKAYGFAFEGKNVLILD